MLASFTFFLVKKPISRMYLKEIGMVVCKDLATRIRDLQFLRLQKMYQFGLPLHHIVSNKHLADNIYLI